VRQCRAFFESPEGLSGDGIGCVCGQFLRIRSIRKSGLQGHRAGAGFGKSLNALSRHLFTPAPCLKVEEASEFDG